MECVFFAENRQIDWSYCSKPEYLGVLVTFVSASLLLSECAGFAGNGSISLLLGIEPKACLPGYCDGDSLFSWSGKAKSSSRRARFLCMRIGGMLQENGE